MNITQALSKYIDELTYESIDKDTLDYCKILITDYLAACAAGKRVNTEFNEAARKVVMDMAGREDSHVIFSHTKIPVTNAAFMYGVFCHGADMDDGHREMMGHPGAPVISAVLPLAEMYGKTGKDVILAIVAGYEVCIRVGACMQPMLVQRGFHSTGVVGSLAAAAASAKLLDLSSKEIENALAIGMTQASGLLMVAESGQMSKPVNPARAASNGVMAALLAAEGACGSENGLESTKGFLGAFSDDVDTSSIIRGLGEEEFKLKYSYIKPYPSCRHSHGVINIAEHLYDGYDNVADIDEVDVYIYPNAISIAGQIIEPKNIDDAKFSIHYTLACTLYQGSFGIEDLLSLDKRLAQIEDILPKIRLISDDSQEDRTKGIRGCSIRIKLKTGQVLEESMTLPKGDPEYPFGWEDIQQKLAICSEGVFSDKEQENLMDVVKDLDRQKNMDDLLKIITV